VLPSCQSAASHPGLFCPLTQQLYRGRALAQPARPPAGSQASPRLPLGSAVFWGARSSAAEPGYSVQHRTQRAAKHTPGVPPGTAVSSRRHLLDGAGELTKALPATVSAGCRRTGAPGRLACRHTAWKPLTAFKKIFSAGAQKDLLVQVPVVKYLTALVPENCIRGKTCSWPYLKEQGLIHTLLFRHVPCSVRWPLD